VAHRNATGGRPVVTAVDVVHTHPSDGQWRRTGLAAALSIVTMPVTAIWFLLIGGLMFATSAAVAAVNRAPRLGSSGFVGLGLLAGPAAYLTLAAFQ